MAALLKNMGIDHSGGYIPMTQQGLYHTNIRSAFQKMGCKTVAEGMSADFFVDLCLSHSCLDGLIDNGWIDMVTPDDTGSRVSGQGAGRENILPPPFFCGIWILSGEGMGQVDLAIALFDVI